MIYSMTGFGTAETDARNYHIKVEVKTLNSKFLDISLRLPRELADKEQEVKLLLTQHLKRGKLTVLVEVQPIGMVEPTVHINEALFRSYYTKYLQLADEAGANPKDLFRLALHSPDVITSNSSEELVAWATLQKVLLEAIEKCNAFRAQEGNSLKGKMTEYIESIREKLQEVVAQDPNRIRQIRERIAGNLEEIRDKVQIDQNRFEQELVYYVEKLDITEEKVRLERHLDYFLEVMDEGELQGKTLGFISQEIGREINTIGAKANDSVIQRAVVRMKDELEKIKEQSMNIL